MSTALACVLDELPAVHDQMAALAGPVRVARYATFGTEDGTLTYGDDLPIALQRTRLLASGTER